MESADEFLARIQRQQREQKRKVQSILESLGGENGG